MDMLTMKIILAAITTFLHSIGLLDCIPPKPDPRASTQQSYERQYDWTNDEEDLL